MATVTQRINQIKQPRGGYLNPKSLMKIQRDDGQRLWPNENIAPNLVGLVVDNMTRYMLSKNIGESFKFALKGASLFMEKDLCEAMLERIEGLDDDSIFLACKVVGFEVGYRAGPRAYADVGTILPDSNTIHNIRVMVNRSLSVFKEYGPVISTGFDFIGGYSELITKGDGDFLTHDAIWDMKVSMNEPTNKHTLQLIVYSIMGRRSTNPSFKAVKRIGILNPRLNCVYLYDLDNLPQSIIEEVEHNIIGY